MSTTPMTPIPDDPAGTNLPYRGAVDHGVPFQETELADEAHYHTGRPVEYMPEEADAVAIPVRIVQESARELRQFSTDIVELNVTGQVNPITRLAPRDERRSKITIRNNTAGDAFIGTSDLRWNGTESSNGFVLGQDESISLETTEPVYAVAAVGTNVQLSLLIEFRQAVR